MTNYKNDLPPYAEQITVNQNQEVEQIQQILNKFDQLIPEGFTELGQPKKYWGSTEGLDKTLCERYTFKYNNKSYTLDINQELSDKLKLTPKDNFCVKEEVLSRSLEEGGITLNNEEDIFLKKSFTIENLEEDINKLLEMTEELKDKKGKLERENKEIKINRKHWENKYRNERKKSKELEEKLSSIQQELDKEKGWWDKWEKDTINFSIFNRSNNNVFDLDISLRGWSINWEQTNQEVIRFFKQKTYQYYRDK